MPPFLHSPSLQILVDRSFGAKLCDFGLARESVVVRVATRHGKKAASAISHATRTASAAGSIDWSPSAARLHGELGALGMRAPHPNAALVGPAAVHPHESMSPTAAGEEAEEATAEEAAQRPSAERSEALGRRSPGTDGPDAATASAIDGSAPVRRSLPPLTGSANGGEDDDRSAFFEVPPAPPSAVGTLAWTAPEVLCGRLSSTHAVRGAGGAVLTLQSPTELTVRPLLPCPRPHRTYSLLACCCGS